MILRVVSVWVVFWCALWLCAASTLVGTDVRQEVLALANDGQSPYQIVVGESASVATRHAAGELRSFLNQVTGADLPVVDDSATPNAREILVGASQRVYALGLSPEADLGDDGFVIRTAGERLAIVGKTGRGDLYGVYDFLRQEVGCRWFTPSVSQIPERTTLRIDPVNRTVVPTFEYREVMLWDILDADWMARNHLNTTLVPKEKHGGALRFVPGYYVHTFERFLPAEEYFDDHPEYFAEVDGKRLREDTQLCATNPEVTRLVTEKARQLLRDHPDCRVISVSQNDRNDNYCRCATCAAVDEREGSHAAQVLTLVNAVAEGIAAEFPDRLVETLAYEWSIEPPRAIRPRGNVIIRLSTIRASFSTPLEENKRFKRYLTKWARLTPRIWIWDYTTYYSYYPLPWPNYAVMDDNLRFFAANNVRGVLEQNNWQSTGSDMALLKGYLLARLLWDPQADADALTDEFLEGVYGPAAPHIRAYLRMLSDKVASEGIHLGIYGSRTPKYLTREILEAGDKLWEQAADSVADQPEVLQRVQLARLSHDYAHIEHYRWKPEPMVTCAGRPMRSRVLAIQPSYRERIERFLKYSRIAGITHIREGEPDYADYAAWLRNLLAAPDSQ